MPRPAAFFAACCATSTAASNTTTHPPSTTTLPHTFSSSSDPPSTTSSATSASFDETASLQTLPSIPSIQSLNSILTTLNPPPSSTTFICLSTLSSPKPSPTALAISLSPLLLYSASEASILVYSITDLRLIESFSPPPGSGSLKSITLSHDCSKIFTAHQDGRIRVWRKSASSGLHRLIATLPTAADRLRRLPFPSSYITTRRHKNELWIQHADAVSAVTLVNGDGNGKGLLYSVSWDKTMKIWRASDLRCIKSVTAHEDAVNAVVVSNDGTVYTGSADRRIRVWARGHELVATLDRHRSAVNALALNEDGSVLYSGACDRSILVWEREESANYMVVVGALRGHGRAIMCLVCAGDVVVSGSSDRTVRVWRRGRVGEGYSCLAVMEGHVRGVRSVAAVQVAEEEYRVCSGSVDGEVRVWRVRISSVKGPELLKGT